MFFQFSCITLRLKDKCTWNGSVRDPSLIISTFALLPIGAGLLSSGIAGRSSYCCIAWMLLTRGCCHSFVDELLLKNVKQREIEQCAPRLRFWLLMLLARLLLVTGYCWSPASSTAARPLLSLQKKKKRARKGEGEDKEGETGKDRGDDWREGDEKREA